VTFTLTGPDIPVPRPIGPVASVDLGWRRLTAGEGVRVATVVTDAGDTDYIICPERVLSRLEHCERIRAFRDDGRNAILEHLCSIDWKQAPEPLVEIGLSLQLRPASSFGRLARLARIWRDYSDWRPLDFRAAENWRRWDKLRWEEEANLRDKALAHRDDCYRKEAARIASKVSTLILEDFNIAAAARLETPTGEETTQVAAMRRYRTIAAPGEL
jgi:hypothetical protein